MYGYIRYFGDELKIRDLKLFQSYYCGLCQALSNECGAKGRLLLSYDLTFFALFFDALADDPPPAKEGRCPFRPLKRRQLISASPGVVKAARLSLLLSRYKLEDHRRDEGGLVAPLALGLYRRSVGRAAQQEPALAALTDRCLQAFYAGERDSTKRDELIDPFAALLAETLADNEPAALQPALRKLGYHCGRWIYLIDALDDLPEDMAKQRFNGLLPTGSQWREQCGALTRELENDLYFSLGEMSDALETLPLQRHQELIRNIIYLGLRGVTDRLLAERGGGGEEKFAAPFRLRTAFSHKQPE